ncbi:MAG: type I-E CRISPR-associated protein Cas5/CasD [Firmicutes bacterium]|nr:type I-E CRISPR-associated protein Cas5/CasD [Bacillota bacterium]
MSALLLRLAAPLQSWGVDAKFERRGTERVPTKSGVIGLIAAAQGRQRNESMDDLKSLHFGVRVDREGVLLRDYHTAKNEKVSYVTNRYYLTDAVFLVGLEGDEKLLSGIENALVSPAFPLFLGRRSCPPEGQVSLGIRTGKTLLEALQEETWLVSDWAKKREAPEVHLRIVTDAGEEATNTYFQRDLPVTFDQTHRKFGFRRVCQSAPLIVSNSHSRRAVTLKPTAHEPMTELEEA